MSNEFDLGPSRFEKLLANRSDGSEVFGDLEFREAKKQSEERSAKRAMKSQDVAVELEVDTPKIEEQVVEVPSTTNTIQNELPKYSEHNVARRHTELPANFHELNWDRGVKFYYEGSDKLVQLRVPSELVSVLREVIRPYGNDFAQEISMISLLSAFIVAHTGVRSQFDVNTEQAIAAFKLAEPTMSAIEARLDEIRGDMIKLQSSTKRMRQDISGISDNVDAVLLAESWHIADRVEAIGDVSLDTAASVTVDHPKALAARTNIKDRARVLTDMEERSEGRPIR